jgi:hypothetical protein
MAELPSELNADAEQFVGVDADIATEASVTDAGVRQYPERTEELAVTNSSGNSDAERTRDKSVTLAAAYQAATVLKEFCQQNDINVDTFRIEEALAEFSLQRIKQSKITAFFQHNVNPVIATEVCCVCLLDYCGSHFCTKCKKRVHAFCGTVVDENEGFGRPVVCKNCTSAWNVTSS